MICGPVRRDNPQNCEGFSDRRRTNHTLSHLYHAMYRDLPFAHYGVSHAKDWYLWIVVQVSLTYVKFYQNDKSSIHCLLHVFAI